MRTEEIITKRNTDQDPHRALGEIRDRIVMVNIASDYICEDIFLKKIGFTIENNIEILKEYAEYLRKEFVGKPLDEVELSHDLEKVTSIAQDMQKPDKELCAKCVQGELGKELTDSLTLLTRGINTLRDRMEGGSLSYSRVDSFLAVFSRLGWIAGPISKVFRSVYKIVLLLLIVCLAVFAFLYFTMETEQDLLKKIEQYEADIQSEQTVLAPLDNEMKQIKAKSEQLARELLNRNSKIEVMDLNVQFYSLAEKREKIELRLEALEKLLEQDKRRLEDLKKKSFLERLLRQ